MATVKMKSLPLVQQKFNWDTLGCAGMVNNMFKVVVSFELDTDFTLAQHSLPEYLMAKLKVSHEWNGQNYMVCQMILTQEMTRDDLIELVTMVRKWMDGGPPEETEQQERNQLWQHSKQNQKEKITPTLALSDQQQKE